MSSLFQSESLSNENFAPTGILEETGCLSPPLWSELGKHLSSKNFYQIFETKIALIDYDDITECPKKCLRMQQRGLSLIPSSYTYLPVSGYFISGHPVCIKGHRVNNKGKFATNFFLFSMAGELFLIYSVHSFIYSLE